MPFLGKGGLYYQSIAQVKLRTAKPGAYGEPLKDVVSEWGRSKRHTELHLFITLRFRFLVSV